MNLNDTNIAVAFQPLAEEIKSAFVRRVTRQATNYFENFGNTRPGHYEVGQDKHGYNVRLIEHWGVISRFLKNVEEGYQINGPQELDVAYLDKVATQMAEDSVAGMIAKTLQKVGDLEDIDLFFRGQGDFVIQGVRNGKDVRCDQQTVWKISKHNNHYTQFPMRLYVEGQFTTAAAFEEAIAA